MITIQLQMNREKWDRGRTESGVNAELAYSKKLQANIPNEAGNASQVAPP